MSNSPADTCEQKTTRRRAAKRNSRNPTPTQFSPMNFLTWTYNEAHAHAPRNPSPARMGRGTPSTTMRNLRCLPSTTTRNLRCPPSTTTRDLRCLPSTTTRDLRRPSSTASTRHSPRAWAAHAAFVARSPSLRQQLSPASGGQLQRRAEPINQPPRPALAGLTARQRRGKRLQASGFRLQATETQGCSTPTPEV